MPLSQLPGQIRSGALLLLAIAALGVTLSGRFASSAQEPRPGNPRPGLADERFARVRRLYEHEATIALAPPSLTAPPGEKQHHREIMERLHGWAGRAAGDRPGPPRPGGVPSGPRPTHERTGRGGA